MRNLAQEEGGSRHARAGGVAAERILGPELACHRGGAEGEERGGVGREEAARSFRVGRERRWLFARSEATGDTAEESGRKRHDRGGNGRKKKESSLQKGGGSASYVANSRWGRGGRSEKALGPANWTVSWSTTGMRGGKPAQKGVWESRGRNQYWRA